MKNRKTILIAFIALVSNTLCLHAQYTQAGGTGSLNTITGSSSSPDKSTALTGLITSGKKNIAITGNVTLGDIKLESDVNINISPGVIIKLKPGAKTIFDVASDSYSRITNVKIDCNSCSNSQGDKNNPAKRFTMDVSAVAPSQTATAVKLGNIYNFRLAHFIVNDNYTKINAITLIPVLDVPAGIPNNDQPKYLRNITIKGAPKKGEIQYGHLNKGHIGYGLIQVQSAGHVGFSNLSTVGGVALRLETGSGIADVKYNRFPFTSDNGNIAKPNNIFGGIHEVVGTNISCLNGWSAVTFSPHLTKNGKVTINGASATGSCSTIRIISGFKDSAINGLANFPNADFKYGTFGPVIIKGNITAESDNKAQLEKRDYDYYPGSFKGTKTFEQKFPLATFGPNFPVEGGGEDSARINCPSLANVLYTAKKSASTSVNNNEGEYEITFQSPTYTNTNFVGCISNILYANDKKAGCRASSTAKFDNSNKEIEITKTETVNNSKYSVSKENNNLSIETIKSAQIHLINSLGQIVKTTISNNSSTIDISNLNNGIYFLRIQFEDETFSKKIIL